jgi:hypothetical protein
MSVMTASIQASSSLLGDRHAWVTGLAEAAQVPWQWRSVDVLEVGSGAPWVSVLVQFGSSGEWASVWFERSPAASFHRGQMRGDLSVAQVVRSVYLDMVSSLDWNSWLSWFEQQHGIDELLPAWVRRGLVRKDLRSQSEARGSASARQGGNFRRAAQRAHESLAASHREEYESLLEQFLVLEGLASEYRN